MGDLSPLTESFVFGSSTGTAALGLNPDSPGLSRIVLVPESPFPRHSAPGGWRLGQNLGLWSAHRISDFITLQMLVNCLQRASQSRNLCPSHAFLGAEKTETKESTARSLPCPPICPGGGLLGARPSPFPLAFSPSRSLPAGLAPCSSVLLARLVPPSPPRVGDRWRGKEGETGEGCNVEAPFQRMGEAGGSGGEIRTEK